MYTSFREYFSIPTIDSEAKKKKDALFEFKNEFQGMEFGEGIWGSLLIKDVF